MIAAGFLVAGGMSSAVEPLVKWKPNQGLGNSLAQIGSSSGGSWGIVVVYGFCYPGRMHEIRFWFPGICFQTPVGPGILLSGNDQRR